jgi:hypothetical protein
LFVLTTFDYPFQHANTIASYKQSSFSLLKHTNTHSMVVRDNDPSRTHSVASIPDDDEYDRFFGRRSDRERAATAAATAAAAAAVTLKAKASRATGVTVANIVDGVGVDGDVSDGDGDGNGGGDGSGVGGGGGGGGLSSGGAAGALSVIVPQPRVVSPSLQHGFVTPKASPAFTYADPRTFQPATLSTHTFNSGGNGGGGGGGGGGGRFQTPPPVIPEHAHMHAHAHAMSMPMTIGATLVVSPVRGGGLPPLSMPIPEHDYEGGAETEMVAAMAVADACANRSSDGALRLIGNSNGNHNDNDNGGGGSNGVGNFNGSRGYEDDGLELRTPPPRGAAGYVTGGRVAYNNSGGGAASGGGGGGCGGQAIAADSMGLLTPPPTTARTEQVGVNHACVCQS